MKVRWHHGQSADLGFVSPFLTRDPLDGENGTTTVANPYHYTSNDPLNHVLPATRVGGH